MHGAIQVGIIVIFGIVMLPVYAMLLGWFIGKPRQYKPVAIAFGYIFAYTLFTVVALGAVGTFIGLIA